MKKGWRTKTLGEICDIERGGSPRPIQEFITTEPNGINWIKIGDGPLALNHAISTMQVFEERDQTRQGPSAKALAPRSKRCLKRSKHGRPRRRS